MLSRQDAAAASPTTTIREYDERRDRRALRECVAELQEYERSLHPTMPAGAEMVEPYLALTLRRCSEWDGKVFLAERDGRVVGYACVWGRVPSEEPDDDPAPYSYLSDLLVRADFRGQGVGRCLMHEAEAYARDCGTGALRVRMLARNARARRFYGANGFAEFEIEMLKRLG